MYLSKLPVEAGCFNNSFRIEALFCRAHGRGTISPNLNTKGRNSCCLVCAKPPHAELCLECISPWECTKCQSPTYLSCSVHIWMLKPLTLPIWMTMWSLLAMLSLIFVPLVMGIWKLVILLLLVFFLCSHYENTKFWWSLFRTDFVFLCWQFDTRLLCFTSSH